MENVKTISLTSLTNVYHVSFHSSVSNLVQTFTAAELGLDSNLFEQYKYQIVREQDLVNRTTASDKTVLIRTSDTERCRIFRYVLGTISNMKYSNVPEIVQGAPVAESKILSKYGLSIVKEADQKKTALIRGFVFDVQQFLRGYITGLGIESALTALTTANESFQTSFLERVDEQATVSMSSKELRAQTDHSYQKIVVAVNYFASLDTATDETSVTRREYCQVFIKDLNTLQKRLRQSIKMGTSLSNADKTDNGSSTSGGNSSTPASGGQEGSSNTDTGGSSNPGNLTDLG